jgi:hypothetical protein
VGFLKIGLEQEALTIHPGIDPGMLIQLSRSQDAIKAAEENLAKAPADNVYARANLGYILASADEYVRARPLMEETWIRNKRQVNWGLFGVSDAAALIAIRRHAGEEAGVDELLEAMRDDVGRLREAGFVTTWYFSTDFAEGLAAYLAGEHSEGISLIARAAQDGYYIPPNTAYLQALYDDPDFAPILARQQARQARERERFLPIVCDNNPYSAVWQPAEETCERFAPEGTGTKP